MPHEAPPPPVPAGAEVFIALVGDRSEEVPAHRAIPEALALAAAAAQVRLRWRWIETASITQAAAALAGCHGVWLTPGSPYANTDGALAAIHWARCGGIPFLGTCGGFQHALIEAVAGAAGGGAARHGETNPGGDDLVVTALSCSLVEVRRPIRLLPDSHLGRAYGVGEIVEGYRCRFGLNPAWRRRLEGLGLRFTAFDETGEVRGAERPDHPFFVGVLFQPERAALERRTPPLVTAFVRAAARLHGGGGAAP